MRIEQHAENTEKLYGCRAEDIHEWIDQYFDTERFRHSVRRGFLDGWNPFQHRRFLHYSEALPKVLEEFKGKYSDDIIKEVFLQHLKDDYHGYIPSRDDFDNEEFLRKYHRLF
ncbi:MAG: hypothetical protein JEZ04_05685 [Spirochaetales bacterium]|nr:hypothetical protein [Spirochaetales bacterium]